MIPRCISQQRLMNICEWIIVQFFVVFDQLFDHIFDLYKDPKHAKLHSFHMDPIEFHLYAYLISKE